MNSLDLIRMGFKNLWRRKVRTLLTILEVVIGTASIIIMISLGLGMKETNLKQVKRMGSLNIINVFPGYGGGYYDIGPIGGRGPGGQDENVILDDELLAQISQIKGVEAVTPIYDSFLKLASGKYIAYAQITGIIPETMEAFDLNTSEGRLLEETDTNALVFGSYIPRTFFNPRSRNWYYGPPQENVVDVINDRIVMTFDMSYGEKIPGQPSQPNKKAPKLYKVRGVGILQEKGDENDYKIFMNIVELKKIVAENERNQNKDGRPGLYPQSNQQGYQRALVKVKNLEDVRKVQEQIKALGLSASSLTDLVEEMQKTSSNIRNVLGGIGAVSLLIAAIGIANTMIMSIYERTKEIGVMKVIGACLGDIKRLFLFEAGLIGLFGGILGLGMSFLTSYILNNAGVDLFGGSHGYVDPEAVMSVIPTWLAFYSIIFTIIVGLLSGYYPARRAMRISPMEAIKTE